MRKIFLSLVLILISLFGVGYGYALFQDAVLAENNKFYSGIFDIQINQTDLDNNNIADSAGGNWVSNTVGVWTSPMQWIPGETVSSKVFIKNAGDVDAEAVYLTLIDRKYTGVRHLDEVINLVDAWYDRNGNGIKDENDDILVDLVTQYDINGGEFTLLDLYSGTDLVHGGTLYDLESGPAVLPGVITNDAIGGNAGTGKGLFMTWQYDPAADVSYQEASIEFDLKFIGEQATN